MAIKPIEFNSNMVRAILDGRKTVTRQVVKGLENYDDFCVLGTDHDMLAAKKNGDEYPKRVKGLWAIFDWLFRDGLIHSRIAKAPYAPEDVLWVREPWNYGFFDGIDREIENSRRFEPLPIGYDLNTAPSHIVHECFVYRADGCAYGTEKEKGELVPMTWRLPINMPRDAARIWLRVTNVRVERLQDIDEAGAKAEGGKVRILKCSPSRTAREDFALIWDGTIKPTDYNRYGWEANPLVWVIEFERCEKPEQCDD